MNGDDLSSDMVINAISTRTIRPGDSTHYPLPFSTIAVHYVASVLNSDGSKEEIDSSWRRKQHYTVKIGATPPQLIEAWEVSFRSSAPNEMSA